MPIHVHTVLAFFKSINLRLTLFSNSVSLREMMRRATSAARVGSGLDSRDSDREDAGMAIPTLSWPPDPAPPYDSLRAGKP